MLIICCLLFFLNLECCELHFRITPNCVVLLYACTHIIIGWSSPEVWFKCSTLSNHFLIVYIIRGEIAILLIESETKLRILHCKLVGFLIILHFHLIVNFHTFLTVCHRETTLERHNTFLKQELIVCNYLSFFHQWLCILQNKRNI